MPAQCEPTDIRNVVFAGGGSRCLWQVGFWDGANCAGLDLNSQVDYAASTSAGCAMATACMLGRGREALDLFKDMTARNPANVHWRNLWPGAAEPVLPHMRMYRSAMEAFLSPVDLDNLRDKHLEFLMAVFPPYLPSVLGTPLAFAVYGLEKHLSGALHPRWTRGLGFRPLTAGNREAGDVAEFIDIVLAASCVPPVLPAGGYGGQRILDGGIIDNVPAHLTDGRSGRTLVLLSKRYRRPLPEPGTRIYVQPSDAIRIDKFDYANPQGLQDTYDIGYRDGTAFAQSMLEGAAC